MNEALLRLANAAGIEGGYWDGLGTWRALNETTALALLRALGVDPAGDVAAQAARLEAGADLDADAPVPILPPVIVLIADDAGETTLAARLTLPLAAPNEPRWSPVRFHVNLESGESREGEFTLEPSRSRQFEHAGVRYAAVEATSTLVLPPGYHRLELPALAAASALIVAPQRCHVAPDLAGGRRTWGIAVHLYALRSPRNWGIGDFTDLARFAEIAGRNGAALVGLNPLHARHLARPDQASPYAPSSRRFLDPMYLDVEAIEDFAHSTEAQAALQEPAFRTELAQARASQLVDHAAVFRLKLPVLEHLFHCFRNRCLANGDADARAADFRRFRTEEGDALERFAEFEALRLDWVELTGSLPQWREWPTEWRDPRGPALAQFRVDAAMQIEFQVYLQWQSARQLDAAARAARAAGLSLGLYCDLAVGAAADSAETWGAQELVAPGVTVGAPPDLLSRNGQNWGLPPWNPRALAKSGYRPFAAMIDHNMQHAAALRIDHVMALLHLFWIPEGMRGSDGGYVGYPFEALTAVIALESVRNRCLVIGEDLGSVPDGLRDRLRDLGFLSYRVLIFERHWEGDGNFKRPWEYPAQALATVATHDMPTIADYWAGSDIDRRAALGLFAEAHLHEEEKGRRGAERQRLLELLGELGLGPADSNDPGQVAEALHAMVARTPSMLAVVQLDDVLGEVEPANIPGTYTEYPNWRRKMSRSLEEIAGDPRLQRLAQIMRDAGRG